MIVDYSIYAHIIPSLKNLHLSQLIVYTYTDCIYWLQKSI